MFNFQLGNLIIFLKGFLDLPVVTYLRENHFYKKSTFGDGLASRVNKNPFLVLVSFLGSNFNESSHLIDVKIHSSFILHFDC